MSNSAQSDKRALPLVLVVLIGVSFQLPLRSVRKFTRSSDWLSSRGVAVH